MRSPIRRSSTARSWPVSRRRRIIPRDSAGACRCSTGRSTRAPALPGGSRGSSASSSFRPLRIALRRVLRPVEHRQAPALSLGMILGRRRTGVDRAVEERRMGDSFTRVACDVERDVADEPDSSLIGYDCSASHSRWKGVLARRFSLAGEPHPLLNPGALRGTLGTLAAVVVRRAGLRQEALEPGNH